MNTVLLIEDEAGRLLTSAVINEKGFSKSLENGLLWTVDLSTGRLLPFGNTGVPFLTLSKETTCIGKEYAKAVVSGEVINRLSTMCQKEEAENAYRNSTKESENTLNIENFNVNSGKNPENLTDEEFPAEFLRSLAQVIHNRRVEMPEGSYTTHLCS